MAKVYLKGSDVENDANRQRARLLGIAHETYVYSCALRGNTYDLNNVTKYPFALKEKMEAVLDENGDPVLDERGNPAYTGTGEYALELDDDSKTETGAYYSSLYSTHTTKLASRAAMESDGWFVDE